MNRTSVRAVTAAGGAPSLLPLVLLSALLAACGPSAAVRHDWGAAGAAARFEATAPGASPAALRRAAATALCGGGGSLVDARAWQAGAIADAPKDGRLQLEAALLAAFADDAAAVLRHGVAAVELLPDGPERAAALLLLRSEARWAAGYEDVVGTLLPHLRPDGPDPDVAEQAGLGIFELLRGAAEDDAARASLQQLGVPVRWRLSAPWGPHGADDFDRPLPPEQELGRPLPPLLISDDAGWPRVIHTVEQVIPDGELFFPMLREAGVGYGEARFALDRGGAVVVQVETPVSVRLWVDGAPVLTLDGVHELGAETARAVVELPAGGHRVLVKLASARPGGWARVRLWAVGGGRVTPDEGNGGPLGAVARGLDPRPGPPLLAERLSAPLPTPAHPERVYDWIARWLAASRRPSLDNRVSDGAARALAEALPRSPAAWTLRGLQDVDDPALPEDLRRSRAAAAFGEGLRLAPEDPSLLAHQARLDREDGRLQEGLARVDRALAADPQHGPSLRLRLHLLAQLGWTAEADLAYEALLQAPLTPETVGTALAWDHASGRWAAAAELSRRWYERAPGAAREAVASLTWAFGDYERAAVALVSWHQANPGLDTPLRHLVQLLRVAGAADDERAALGAWAAAVPTDVWARRRLAERLLMDGDIHAAMTIWEGILTDFPATTEVHEVLGALRDEPVLAAPADTAADWLARYDAARSGALAAWDGAPGVQVLVSTDVRVYPDGSFVEVQRQIQRVQSKEVADANGELAVPPDAILLEARTVQAGGTVREPEVDQGKGALSFSGLGPGDALEVRMMRVQPSRRRTGGTIGSCSVGAFAMPTFALRCRVIVPEGVPVDVTRRNGMPPATTTREGGFVVHTWALDGVPPVRQEPFTAPPAEFVPHALLRYGPDGQEAAAWEVVWRAMRAQLRPRLKPSPELLRFAAGLARDRSPREAARRAYLYVRDEVAATSRPAALSAPAATTLAARKGDPALLLVALLRAQGRDPNLLLCRPRDDAQVADPQPSETVYRRPLVKLRPDDGPALWLDLDDRFTPFGHVPPALRGADCLVVVGPEATGAQAVLVPEDVGAPDEWDFHVTLALDAEGGARGTLRATGSGLAPAAVRRVLGAAKQEERRAVVEDWLRRSLPGVRLESLTFDGLDSAERPLVLAATFAAASVLERRDGRLSAAALVPGPLGSYLTGAPQPDDYLMMPRRSNPLALHWLSERVTLDVTAPPGARFVEAPRGAAEASHGLRFEQSVAAEGARLTVRRRLHVPEGRVQAAEFAGLARVVTAIHQAANAPVRVELGAP
jgi:Flp pilus assembly protein TadD